MNLLDRDTPLRSHGVIREQRMVDGFAPEPGARLYDFVTGYFVSPSSHVTYDLGRVARPGEVTSWATPLVVEHDGKPQIVIPATGRSRINICRSHSAPKLS